MGKRGLSVWDLSSVLSEVWLHCLPQFCVFLFLFVVFHRRGLTLYETFWISFPLGYALISWVVFIVSALMGSVDPTVVRYIYLFFTVLSIPLLAIALRTLYSTPGYLKRIVYEIRQEFLLNLLLLISGAYFSWVFYTHQLNTDVRGNEFSGGSVWADFAFHMNVINSFLHGENKYFSLFSKLKSTIYAGHSMSYPFIPDFHAATLVSLGLSPRQATLIPSVLICMSLAAVLYSFVRRFLSGVFECGRRFEKEAFFSVLLFFLCGSIGGWTMLQERTLSLSEIGNTDWMQRTAADEELYWFSIICHILMPQRTATYAYPLVALVFTSLYSGMNHSNLTYRQRQRLFLLAGCITGLLPLVHAHSFLVVGVVAVVYCLMYPMQVLDPRRGGHFFLWFAFGLPIILLALPQVPSYMDRILGGDSDGHSFIKWAPVWRSHPWSETAPHILDLNFFVLWFKSLTFVVPLGLASFLFYDVKQVKFSVALWAVFVLANLVNFQPWDKDNTKIFAIWMFGAANGAVLVLSRVAQSRHVLLQLVAAVVATVAVAFVASFAYMERPYMMWQYALQSFSWQQVGLWAESHFLLLVIGYASAMFVAVLLFVRPIRQRNWVMKLAVAAIFVSMIFTGTLMCIRETGMDNWQYADPEDHKVAEAIQLRTAHDAIFITSDNHIHPVTGFAGRTTVYGFPGWLHSHGYPKMWEREHELRDFLEFPELHGQFLTKYNISYLCWDYELASTYKFDQAFFDKNVLVSYIYHSYKYKVYDLRQLRDSMASQ